MYQSMELRVSNSQLQEAITKSPGNMEGDTNVIRTFLKVVVLGGKLESSSIGGLSHSVELFLFHAQARRTKL